MPEVRNKGNGLVHTFHVRNISDMLAKLDWEIGQLQRSHISEAVDKLSTSSYFAINGALTAFHVCEWVWHAGSIAQREIWCEGQKGGEPTKTNFQLFLRHECPSLIVCREIANSFKHYAVERHSDKAVTPAATWFTTFPATCGVMRAGDALSAPAAVVMISNGQQTFPVAHVLSRAYGFLEDFCEKHGLLDGTDT